MGLLIKICQWRISVGQRVGRREGWYEGGRMSSSNCAMRCRAGALGFLVWKKNSDWTSANESCSTVAGCFAREFREWGSKKAAAIRVPF